jgi:uncharacterized membrane protein YhaH (DUF805 family)
MEFTESVKRNLTTSAYAQFEGRASRSEYWWFYLGTLAIAFVAGFIEGLAGIPLTVIAVLAMIVPSIALSVRRLHDTNRSGWYLLLGLIPFVGTIVLIYWWASSGDTRENSFGAPSK